MLRIINGNRYNTETAELLCDISQGDYSTNDFKHDDTYLYVTPKGSFFIAGSGGALSRWARSVGNGRTGGAGLEVIDKSDARELLEQYGTSEQTEKYFAVEDA